jgi:hypothetical protein
MKPEPNPTTATLESLLQADLAAWLAAKAAIERARLGPTPPSSD